MLSLVKRAFEGHYEVEREIGKGGNARIYLARDTAGMQVALKILHPELLVSVAADRFLREIKLAKQLDHAHIARLLDSGEREWLVYYVMTYIEGPTLREHLARVGKLGIAETVRLAGDLLDALEHAHLHASCTGTSSRTTSCSRPRAPCCSTSASPERSPPPEATGSPAPASRSAPRPT
jgi:serine/threonine protein kinase